MIPLSIPHINGNEWKYVKECLDTGWVSSVGAYVTRFENDVAHFVGANHGIAAVNGTSALHIALQVVGVIPGDLVILPNMTFVASANSIKYNGADPVLIDIREDTWQMDLDLLLHFLEQETQMTANGCVHIPSNRVIRAIMPVHVLGGMCDMNKLQSIANQYQLKIVEDASEALGTTYQEKHPGTFGDIGVFSFNGNKIITTGGGGVIVTDNEALANKAKHLTTQAKVDNGEYFHDEVGYNYRLVNVLAAIGVAQMEQLPEFVKKKQYIANYYHTELKGGGDITFQEHEPGVIPNEWLVTFTTEKMREVLQRLTTEKVIARPFWVPMNQLPMFKDLLFINEKDVANRIYQRAVSIPSSISLTNQQIETVVQVIKSLY